MRMENFNVVLKTARLEKELTQKKLSEILKIPKRTVEDWEANKRIPPEYVQDLIIEKIRGMKVMKKYQAEEAIRKNGTIVGWDADAFQRDIEADTEGEAYEQAKQYIFDSIVSNGEDPDEADITVRVREIINAQYGEYGKWYYGDYVDFFADDMRGIIVD